jgi:UDP-3-O-acyl N-acetylglucosamine deacetylase
VKRLAYRRQKTLARPVSVEGTGYITGKHVHLRFVPAPASTGVVFVRRDLGPDACIRAELGNVTGTQRRTTLGHAPLCVGLVEHVLAALKGLCIDNCLVELDAPEPPGMDGSASDFVHALCRAGQVLQNERKAIWGVERTLLIQQPGATLALHPAEGTEFRVSYLLDYGPTSPIVRQIYTAAITPETFLQCIAPCRTFLLEEEAVVLRQQGIGKNSTVKDLLVFGSHGPQGGNKLRFGNEPARHKVLDIVGDLALLGHDLAGHLVAYRSGHPLNVELGKTLLARLPHAQPQRRAA